MDIQQVYPRARTHGRSACTPLYGPGGAQQRGCSALCGRCPPLAEVWRRHRGMAEMDGVVRVTPGVHIVIALGPMAVTAAGRAAAGRAEAFKLAEVLAGEGGLPGFDPKTMKLVLPKTPFKSGSTTGTTDAELDHITVVQQQAAGPAITAEHAALLDGRAVKVELHTSTSSPLFIEGAPDDDSASGVFQVALGVSAATAQLLHDLRAEAGLQLSGGAERGAAPRVCIAGVAPKNGDLAAFRAEHCPPRPSVSGLPPPLSALPAPRAGGTAAGSCDDDDGEGEEDGLEGGVALLPSSSMSSDGCSSADGEVEPAVMAAGQILQPADLSELAALAAALHAPVVVTAIEGRGKGCVAARPIVSGELLWTEHSPLVLTCGPASRPIAACDECCRWTGSLAAMLQRVADWAAASSDGAGAPAAEGPPVGDGGAVGCFDHCGAIYCGEACRKNAWQRHHRLLCTGCGEAGDPALLSRGQQLHRGALLSFDRCAASYARCPRPLSSCLSASPLLRPPARCHLPAALLPAGCLLCPAPAISPACHLLSASAASVCARAE